MGGGMPIGAFIASQHIMSVLTHQPVLGHLTTFGGHPVCCAAGLASLEVILTQKLHEKAERKGKLFKKLLKHPAIKEVRGKVFCFVSVWKTGVQMIRCRQVGHTLLSIKMNLTVA